MASAHNLVRPLRLGNNVDHGETTLAAIINTLMLPHAGSIDNGDNPRLVIDGPEVVVRGDAIASIAMVLHEFATNAVKYGALSVPSGRVRVGWTLNRRLLDLTWVEEGGPLITKTPDTHGFGSVLAHNNVTGQLDGQISYDWKPEGVTIKLSASVTRLTPQPVY